MSNKKISIIVPVYNVEKYLDGCIESITEQTYKNLEIILVDDGSSDNSLSICNKWAEKDSRIKVIHKENGGTADTRNRGLDIATGDYIGFVDADDYISPYMYEILLYVADETLSDIVGCNFSNEGILQNINLVRLKDNYIVISKDNFLVGWVKGENSISVCDKIFGAEFLMKTRFRKDCIFEDMFFYIDIMEKWNNMAYIDIPLYYYRENRESKTKSKYNPKRIQYFEVIEDFEKYICAQSPQNKPFLNALKGMESFNFLTLFCSYDNSIEEYPEDYKKFKKMFNQNVLYLLRYRKLSLKKYIEVLIICVSPKLYRFIHRLINR